MSDVKGLSHAERLAVIRGSRSEDLAAACGAVSDRWIDAGRAAELEQMNDELSREFWDQVATELARQNPPGRR